MSFLSKLFGGGGAAKSEPDPEIYKDFKIFADPAKESGGYRIAAKIEKEVNGELKTHHLIRADTVSNYDAAVEATLNKAKQCIDQMGDGIFR